MGGAEYNRHFRCAKCHQNRTLYKRSRYKKIGRDGMGRQKYSYQCVVCNGAMALEMEDGYQTAKGLAIEQGVLERADDATKTLVLKAPLSLVGGRGVPYMAGYISGDGEYILKASLGENMLWG